VRRALLACALARVTIDDAAAERPIWIDATPAWMAATGARNAIEPPVRQRKNH
jgi:hypothetical protein